MSSTRREFLHLGAATAATVGAAQLATPMLMLRAATSVRALKLLVLGGTGFIGPKIVSYALNRGHEITVFNRGRTNTDLFPAIEHLVGDRDGQLDALKGRKWDAVIDNTGYVPRQVRDSADVLRGSVGRYLFTSTGSVYDPDQETLSEDARLVTVQDPKSEDVRKYYGQLKVLCEQVVQERFGDSATIVRPHIVAGLGDKSGRYTYWPVRIDRGGELIAPGDRESPVQYIDVRDLAEFCVHLVENNTSGIFNAAGPTYSELSMAGLLYAVRGITSSDVKFTWVTADFLAQHGVGALAYPLWIPESSNLRGFKRMTISKSVQNGLRLRPLAVTAHDLLNWFYGQSDDQRKRLELNMDREARILAAWHKR